MIKSLNTIQQQLLATLADGACHSGNELGELLNISRTAIWKHMKQLVELGLPILCVPQQGYILTTPIHLLDAEKIRQYLALEEFHQSLALYVFSSIDSTNRFIKNLPSHSSTIVCCAEMQTQGRGRFGRNWYSPFGENIYCSSRWHFDDDLSRLSGLSLVVSLTILDVLGTLNITENLWLKWPNDVLWQDRKLCGNLIEVIAESNSEADIIIGVGLNVNTTMKKNFANNADKPWCSLYDITSRYFDRNQLIAKLISCLNRALSQFKKEGFTVFMPKWQQYDYLYGKDISVIQPTGTLCGKAQGINETGQLILIDEEGKKHFLSSGDTSLHKANSRVN